MNILLVNGSPRKNMNTARLLEKVAEGAASVQAEAELIHLRDYKFSGCISCFHCKDPLGKSYGRCVLKDDLRAVLDKAHAADVLVLGTPFYFCAETALMRAFQERLWFQYLLYSNIKPPLSPRKKATALVYTMNIKEEDMEAFGKNVIVNTGKRCMERAFAPCEILLCTDTKQVPDYSKYEMDMWDAEAKEKRHQEVFPLDLRRAFELGVRLVS